MTTLITFDIDGTIMICGEQGSAHKDGFRHALKTLYNIDQPIADFNGVPSAGCTDTTIVSRAITKIKGGQEPTQEEVDEMKRLTVEYFLANFDGSLELEPGIARIIPELATMPNVRIGIVSGNFPEIGLRKLEFAGLKEYFIKDSIFGFGLQKDRADLLRNAIRTGEKLNGAHFNRVIHVGDAPQDVQCAIDVGVIGVLTFTSWHRFPSFPTPCFKLKNLDVRHDEFLKIVQTGTLSEEFQDNE